MVIAPVLFNIPVFDVTNTPSPVVTPSVVPEAVNQPDTAQNNVVNTVPMVGLGVYASRPTSLEALKTVTTDMSPQEEMRVFGIRDEKSPNSQGDNGQGKQQDNSKAYVTPAENVAAAYDDNMFLPSPIVSNFVDMQA